MPDVTDADVIGAFLSGTTYESLVHKLGRKGLQTTKELLDITTNHASDEDTGKGASNRPNKKNKQRCEGSLVATADRKGVRSPPRVPQTTLRSYSKGHARIMLSPSSTYTRTTSS